MTPAPLPHQRLRAATQASHDQVDAAYKRFDLGDRSHYSEFLLAHARVLPAYERALSEVCDLPSAGSRTPLLRQDLLVLNLSMPEPFVLTPLASPAAIWATLYVVEGSRLGGFMLARSVGGDLPRAFLSAGHARGGWRAMLSGFDNAAAGGEWMEEAVRTAKQVFSLYAASADFGRRA